MRGMVAQESALSRSVPTPGELTVREPPSSSGFMGTGPYPALRSNMRSDLTVFQFVAIRDNQLWDGCRDWPRAGAEYVVCPAELVWRVPEGMGLEQAAVVSSCGLTVAQGLFYRWV